MQYSHKYSHFGKGLSEFSLGIVRIVIRDCTEGDKLRNDKLLKIALNMPKNAWGTDDTNSVIFVQKSFSRCAWMGNLIILKNFSFLSSLKRR